MQQDVVGAAETGSGKTLAFGLPILQRLLEEREKSSKLLAENGESTEKYAQGGILRALIITPTRELALQVLLIAVIIVLVQNQSTSCFSVGWNSRKHDLCIITKTILIFISYFLLK